MCELCISLKYLVFLQGRLSQNEITLAIIYSGVHLFCPTVNEDLVKLACELSDTDGSGQRMHLATFLAKLRQLHDETVDQDNVQAAKECLGMQGATLADAVRSRASADGVTISDNALRELLVSKSYDMPEEVVSSVLRSKVLRSDGGPISVSKFLTRMVPSADEELFAPLRVGLLEKYHTINSAFR